MYINPFVCGILVTLAAEAVAIVIAAILMKNKK